MHFVTLGDILRPVEYHRTCIQCTWLGLKQQSHFHSAIFFVNPAFISAIFSHQSSFHFSNIFHQSSFHFSNIFHQSGFHFSDIFLSILLLFQQYTFINLAVFCHQSHFHFSN